MHVDEQTDRNREWLSPPPPPPPPPPAQDIIDAAQELIDGELWRPGTVFTWTLVHRPGAVLKVSTPFTAAAKERVLYGRMLDLVLSEERRQAAGTLVLADRDDGSSAPREVVMLNVCAADGYEDLLLADLTEEGGRPRFGRLVSLGVPVVTGALGHGLRAAMGAYDRTSTGRPPEGMPRVQLYLLDAAARRAVKARPGGLPEARGAVHEGFWLNDGTFATITDCREDEQAADVLLVGLGAERYPQDAELAGAVLNWHALRFTGGGLPRASTASKA